MGLYLLCGACAEAVGHKATTRFDRSFSFSFIHQLFSFSFILEVVKVVIKAVLGGLGEVRGGATSVAHGRSVCKITDPCTKATIWGVAVVFAGGSHRVIDHSSAWLTSSLQKPDSKKVFFVLTPELAQNYIFSIWLVAVRTDGSL